MSFNSKKDNSQFSSPSDSGNMKELVLGDPEFEMSSEDVLDMSKINFDNDETWLYKVSENSKFNLSVSTSIKHQTEPSSIHNIADISSKGANLKNINTQTFTRPKKKFLRPSIEIYNRELFGDNNETMNISSSPESPSFLNKTITKDSVSIKPLEFDLSQSINSNYFNQLAVNVENEDTFQNMSPPSLVNSLCSSTFTNLMESSLIRNDPVLKQICDTDFTTSILSQGSEPPSLIQSLSYSTNSVDDFLTRVSQDGTLKSVELCESEVKCSGDGSYVIHKKERSGEDLKMSHIMDFEEFHDASDINFIEGQNKNRHNGTYRKNNRLSSATFRKTDFNRSSIGRNHTYEIHPQDVEEAKMATMTIESPKSTKTPILITKDETLKKSNSMENFKNNTIIKDSCNNDLNRYASKENDLGIDCLNSQSGSKKSLDCSIGSADSLDRMSTLSSSSKGSNKMLNMEEVEAIAEKQEQSLQIMSTPKPAWSNKVLNRFAWDHNIISPIVTGDIQSDSGESSDEYKSVKSTFSKNSVESNPLKQTRSLVSLQDPTDARKLKSINTLVNQGSLCKVPARGSANNLPKMVAPCPRTSHSRLPSGAPITTNLKTMRPTLKGSYTSLKPVNAHLPVAPPINAPVEIPNMTYLAPMNTNTQIQGAKSIRSQRIENSTFKISDDGVFTKPTGPLKSGLPRPTSSTSIPRPSASRIPGPRRFTYQKQDPSKL